MANKKPHKYTAAEDAYLRANPTKMRVDLNKEFSGINFH